MSAHQRPRWPGMRAPGRGGRLASDPSGRAAGAGAPLLAPPAGAVPEAQWATWLRVVEQKRRLLARQQSRRAPRATTRRDDPWFVRATAASFRLEGLHTDDAQLAAVLAPGAAAARTFRSRHAQRCRNHVAILHHIESILACGRPLRPADVVRWYTSIALGLCTARLAEPTTARMESVVRQVNSPHLRLRPAVEEVARLHQQLLADPLVPSFNGILARLLLRYHLGRCGLPPVVLDDDPPAPPGVALLPRLMALIVAGYDGTLAKNRE